MTKEIIKIVTIEGTKKLAIKIARQLRGGDTICLIGDLGVGKTYFTKFLAEELGVDPDEVTSPTFVYWRQHRGKRLGIHHFDFYRLEGMSEEQLSHELGNMGFDEAYTDQNSITIIEWADRVYGFLPEERIEIHIENKGDLERTFKVKTFGEKYQNLVIS